MLSTSILPRRAARAGARLLVLFVLVAAVINVPWAVTFMRWSETPSLVPTTRMDRPNAPKEWPSSTPHAAPWPPPDEWEEGGAFGFRTFNVFGGLDLSKTNPSRFQMEVHLFGWPLPVIEKKQMWWDWNDPTLAGPESDPAPFLRFGGLLLNPLLLGGAAWMIFVFPWLAAVITIRRWRHRRNRCMACGYPIGASAWCTECGNLIRPMPSTSTKA
jgi:hypothetical protein